LDHYPDVLPGAFVASLADDLTTLLSAAAEPDRPVGELLARAGGLAPLPSLAVAAPSPPDRVAHPETTAPSTPQEELLCDLFAEVLKLSRFGPHDNFFEGGGHSLLAAQLVSRIRTALGVKLTVRSLLRTPTPAGLAAGLGVDDPLAALDVVLPLRTTGDRPALFCLHPAGGLSWCYTGLLRYVPPGRPIYGLQACGIASPSDRATGVAQMA